MTKQTPMIALSERVYQALLILYPAEYRHDYGALMLQVFRDVSRDAYLTGGFSGIALWWCATLLDLTVTVIEQRRNVRIVLTRATLIQLAGIFLIVGGACCAIASYSQLQPEDHYSYHDLYQLAILLLLPAYALIGVGNIGILLRYGDGAGLLGRLALVATGIGALTIAVGFGLAMVQDSFWTVSMIGLSIHTVDVVGIALLHLRTGFLPVTRWLSVVLGLQPLLLVISVLGLQPLLLVFSVLGLQPILVFGEPQSSADNHAVVAEFAWLIGIGVAWILLGTAVHRHQARLIPAAAASG